MKLKLLLIPLALGAGLWLRPGAPPPLAPPPGMVAVPGGECTIGSDDPDAESLVKPARRIYVAPFYIDRLEVTRSQYHAFDPSYPVPPGTENHPATHLTREQAERYLAGLGKRLPTGIEWEKAARGSDGRRYPWGDQFEASRGHFGNRQKLRQIGCGLPRLTDVGSFPGGASPYGCLDMAGNAWEWVSDDFPGPPTRQVIRGGAFAYPERYLRTYAFNLEETGIT